MEPQVNYDQRYSGLLTVYRLRSFAAAAVELSLTASAVSKQIRSLESDLGRPLFIRSGSRLIPTRACEAIVPFAEKIDALCVRMQQELASTDRSVRHLVVGVTPSAESSAISQVLTRYASEHNDTQITIVSEGSAALHDMLQAGAIDLAVVDGGFSADGFNSILSRYRTKIRFPRKALCACPNCGMNGSSCARPAPARGIFLRHI